MAPAASAAAGIALYAKAGTAMAGVAGAFGTAGWFIAGFGKIKCPACSQKVAARDFHEHAKNHPFACRSCDQSVPFLDMEEHLKTHGYSCPICERFVSLTDMEEHVMSHPYRCPRCKKSIPFADMEAHFEIHEAEDDEYSRRRQEVAIAWGYLKVECPICKADICLRDAEAHSAMHWMDRAAKARGQDGSVNVQAKGRSRGLKIRSLVCRRTHKLTIISASITYSIPGFVSGQQSCVSSICGLMFCSSWSTPRIMPSVLHIIIVLHPLLSCRSLCNSMTKKAFSSCVLLKPLLLSNFCLVILADIIVERNINNSQNWWKKDVPEL